jgi:predicted  nucleic acid-binding Zn-ribbon protein
MSLFIVKYEVDRMDERKKTIRDLEDKKQANLEGVNRLLEALGETLLTRKGGLGSVPGEKGPQGGGGDPDVPADSPQGTRENYRRLLREIADGGDIIKSTEADTRRLKELDDEIAGKEKRNSDNRKGIALLYAQLGQCVLSDPAFSGFSTAYKDQTDDVFARIDAQELKLDELEQQTGGILSWLGKNAQGLVVKTALVRNRAALHKIYRSAGERFVLSGEDPGAGDEDARDLYEKIADLRRNSEDLAGEIIRLKEERRKIGDLFSAGGGPVKRVLNLEKQIAKAKEELRTVYRLFGEYALNPVWKDYYAPFLMAEDSAQGEKIDFLKKSVRDTETRIEKLRAAIAIDDEKAEIEKLKCSIEDQRRKIRAAQDVITDLETRISGAEHHIEELTKLL